MATDGEFNVLKFVDSGEANNRKVVPQTKSAKKKLSKYY